MNVEPTAETILNMSEVMQRCARDLKEVSERMVAENNFEITSEAASIVANCILNIRLDLLVARPIRELQRQIILAPKE